MAIVVLAGLKAGPTNGQAGLKPGPTPIVPSLTQHAPGATSVGQWVAFDANFVRTEPGRRRVVGWFHRAADGSTREESNADGPSKPVVLIMNVARELQYRFEASTRIRTARRASSCIPRGNIHRRDHSHKDRSTITGFGGSRPPPPGLRRSAEASSEGGRTRLTVLLRHHGSRLDCSTRRPRS